MTEFYCAIHEKWTDRPHCAKQCASCIMSMRARTEGITPPNANRDSYLAEERKPEAQQRAETFERLVRAIKS